MLKTETQRLIAAPPERIWPVLTNAKTLADGSFGIIRLEGEIEPGGKIRLWSEVSPDRAFALRVARFEPNRRMVWRGGMPLGLFSGTRTFTLLPETGGTLFHMQEVFTGPMAGMITSSMPNLTPSFEKFAVALAASTERQDA